MHSLHRHLNGYLSLFLFRSLKCCDEAKRLDTDVVGL